MNNITIELCTEDRARIDRLIAAMEHRTCDSCVTTARAYVKQATTESDPITEKLAQTLAKAEEPTEAPKNATEKAEEITPPTTQAEEERPTREEIAQPEPIKEPTITKAELQQKITQLAAANNGAKKAQVREIVKSYAETVSKLPEDKYSEIWARLTALESEG